MAGYVMTGQGLGVQGYNVQEGVQILETAYPQLMAHRLANSHSLRVILCIMHSIILYLWQSATPGRFSPPPLL